VAYDLGQQSLFTCVFVAGNEERKTLVFALYKRLDLIELLHMLHGVNIFELNLEHIIIPEGAFGRILHFANGTMQVNNKLCRAKIITKSILIIVKFFKKLLIYFPSNIHL
jgi:hypothetical protein